MELIARVHRNYAIDFITAGMAAGTKVAIYGDATDSVASPFMATGPVNAMIIPAARMGRTYLVFLGQSHYGVFAKGELHETATMKRIAASAV